MNLEQAFDDFYEEIQLDALPEGRISDAWNRLQNYLVNRLGLPAADVFLQGSYANDTSVQPVKGGEYDLDVVAICADAGASADSALKALEDALSEDEDYKKRIDVERQPKPCVRLRYADDDDGAGFHVDIVPARPAANAALAIPLRGNGWRETAPREYTAWCLRQGDDFKRVVRMLKRWRDENDKRRGIKSVVLQVLIADALANATPAGSDTASLLIATLEGIQQRLRDYPTKAPEVRNPVLPSENFADRWPDSDYQEFRRNVDEAVQLAWEALEQPDEKESHKLWQKLFGDDFPPEPTRPSQRQTAPPPAPPPGHEQTPQRAPRRERYACA